jgi:Kef-type K+ transport system membrane component KefB
VTLLGLAGIIAASLTGPMLAVAKRIRMPVVVGELAVGVLLGNTGLRWVHSNDPVLTFLALAGFALVMLIAGTHVPVGNPALRKAFVRGLILAAGVGVLAVPVAAGLSAVAHTHHVALYTVLLASSSAAVVMPIIQEEALTGDNVLTLMAQVAIADTACIIALPLVADPPRAGRAAVGTVIVLAVAGLLFLVLRELAERGLLTRLRAASVRHTFGLEMRLSLAALFGLAGLAVSVHVSVMLAGFAFGLVLAAIGTPRRLAAQLFAVTEGFLGPIFLIWLGASLDLRALAHHPRLLVLAVGLAIGTTVIHALGRLLGQPLPLAILASAQLGVPVAAVALGAQNHLLTAGEGGAILGAAVLSLGVAGLGGSKAQSQQEQPVPLPPRPREPASPQRVEVADRTPATSPSATPSSGAGNLARAAASEIATRDAAAESAARKKAAEDAEREIEVAARAASLTPKPKSKSPPGASPSRATSRSTPHPASKPIVQSNVRIQPAKRLPPADDDA